jgi:hypothetical protein
MDEKLAASTQTFFRSMRYVDAPAAIEWLEKAFGFRRQMVVPNPDGTIAHAQLIGNGGMIMLGSYRADAFGYRTPRAVGGAKHDSSHDLFLARPSANCTTTRWSVGQSTAGCRHSRQRARLGYNPPSRALLE